MTEHDEPAEPDVYDRLEEAIRDYFNETDGPGLTLGAILVVERRVENTDGPDGADVHDIRAVAPFDATPMQRLGLAHWAREWFLRPGEEED